MKFILSLVLIFFSVSVFAYSTYNMGYIWGGNGWDINNLLYIPPSTGSYLQVNGLIKPFGSISLGTKFTTSGCSISSTTGGATAGSMISGTTGTCTIIITMNGATGLTAPNGWNCANVSDITTIPALFTGLMHVTSYNTTSCTISGTTVSGDEIDFSSTGF